MKELSELLPVVWELDHVAFPGGSAPCCGMAFSANEAIVYEKLAKAGVLAVLAGD